LKPCFELDYCDNQNLSLLDAYPALKTELKSIGLDLFSPIFIPIGLGLISYYLVTCYFAKFVWSFGSFGAVWFVSAANSHHKWYQSQLWLLVQVSRVLVC
jgi:hypothetical protein